MKRVAGKGATWLEGSGDWSWPGLRPAPAAPLAPASWVPALPARREAPLPRRPVARRRTLPRPLRLLRLLVLLAVAGGTFLASGTLLRFAGAPVPASAPAAAFGRTFAARLEPAPLTVRLPSAALPAPPPPTPVVLSADAAGSTIASITYVSAALRRSDRFLVYLPPGYAAARARRYPVLYLLHGFQQPASSFLRLGLQGELDRLIGAHAIRPLIAVMLAGANSPQNWENSWAGGYFDYVGEVRRLVDRTLRTIPDRGARAIAGYSMGGFGAMHVALARLGAYSVVESWEGQFANLGSVLRADRRRLAHLPLHAFVWGGRQDTVVGWRADGPWAAALRAAGAFARSAVYPGEHAFAPIERHLPAMLTYAGRALRS